MRTRAYGWWLCSAALGVGASACSIYNPSLLDPAPSSGGSAGPGGGSSGTTNDAGVDASVGGSSSSGGADAGGGVSGGGGSAGSGAGAGGGSGLDTEILDDMEDGDGFLYRPGQTGRNGDWFTGNDATDGGTQFPVPGMFRMSDKEMPDGGATCIDDCVAYTQGGGFAIWGAVMGANIRGALVNDAGVYEIPPYDASGYCGVRFSAKVGADSTPQVRFAMADKSSFPTGGVCNPDASLPHPQGCNDHHGVMLTLSTEWQTYEILFSEFYQNGTGLDAPFDPANVYTIEFPVGPQATFELWLDDILFLKIPEAGTCPEI